MGSKTQLVKISSVVLWIAASALARPPIQEIQIHTQYESEKKPLTTEMIWKLDPLQTNPHRQKWVLSRKTELGGVKAVPLPEKKQTSGRTWGVKPGYIENILKGYARGPGVWYQPLSELGCNKKPNSWFGTEEGSRWAVAHAADAWATLLAENRIKLSLLLEQVQAPSENDALRRAGFVFKQWLNDLEPEWKTRVHEKIRQEEWDKYLEEAKEAGFCDGKQTEVRGLTSWKSIMEPMMGPEPAVTSLLARAPVRFWDGLFTIRVMVNMGGNSLNGRFLIDSALDRTIISPDWIQAQGIPPVWVEIPKVTSLPILWSNLWDGSRRGNRAWIDGLEISGLKVPLQEVLLHETEFFGPPENVGNCCDGIIGNDVLRMYAVEFRVATPAEIRIWPKEGFHKGADPWFEVSETPQGQFVSSCGVKVDSSDSGAKSESKKMLEGVRWNTGSPNGIQVHTHSKHDRGKKGSIFCGDTLMGSQVPIDSSQQTESVPAVDLGMGFLSSAKSFTLDIPHGRVWISDELPLSGLKPMSKAIQLKYIMKKDERLLIVHSLTPSYLDQLKKDGIHLGVQDGLKVGTVLTRINGQPVEELDQWNVDRILAGDSGLNFKLEWKSRKNVPMGVTLPVSP